jgi:D-alanyl-D-alanine-carboxypeptidase/D-alanyl-D-alanine-endopeptidase
VFNVKPPPVIGAPGGVEISEGKPAFIAKIQRAAFLDGGAATVAWLQTQDPALATEADVNEIGYALLAHQRDKDAIALLEWNLQRFPRSWNAHDSLADGYRHVGDRTRAIASYKRSLELNPKNDNAKRMIETMR